MSKRVLSFDLGASGGRAVLGIYDGSKIKLQDIHRFPNEPVYCSGHLYWDVLRLFQELKSGLRKAHSMGGFDSIGICAWGMDYGLIDKRGCLLSNPLHYRDKRTDGMARVSEKYISSEELYMHTGFHGMQGSTAFQLLEHKLHAPELLEQAQAFLLIPDLFAYLLTGDISTERTIASTTQLFSPFTGGWSADIAESLELPEHIFPPVMETGAKKGMLSEEICEELGIPSVPVIAVCGHGAQCGIAAVPSLDCAPFVFINCGAFSRFGTELHSPVIHPQAAAANLTNEAGYENTTTLFRNLSGLWMLQETRRTLIRKGRTYSYAELEKMAAQSEPGIRFIDADAPAFAAPGDMPRRIHAWCIESGQPEPADIAEVLRCIYESLACKFRDTLNDIRSCTDREYDRLFMLGGGSKDTLLCQLTADICGIPVLTGPAEAASYGNTAMQLIAGGEFSNLQDARIVIAASVTIKEYTPNPKNSFIYENYRKVFHS